MSLWHRSYFERKGEGEGGREMVRQEEMVREREGKTEGEMVKERERR